MSNTGGSKPYPMADLYIQNAFLLLCFQSTICWLISQGYYYIEVERVCTFYYQISSHFYYCSQWGYLILITGLPSPPQCKQCLWILWPSWISYTNVIPSLQLLENSSKPGLVLLVKSVCPTHSAFSLFIISLSLSCLIYTTILILIPVTSTSSNNFHGVKNVTLFTWSTQIRSSVFPTKTSYIIKKTY